MTAGKIVITGGRGFTGQHFIKYIQEKGYSHHSLYSNLLDFPAVSKEILSLNPDYIVHLAGISYVASEDKAAFYQVHVDGTKNLLEAALNLKKAPRKVLVASSSTVYGNPSIHPTPEFQTLSPIDDYGISKVKMEGACIPYMSRLPIIIARPFNYTGPGQSSSFLIPKLIHHFLSRKIFIELGNLDVIREFNDVTTICQAYLALILFGKPGEIYNVCTGSSRSLDFVIKTLIGITKHNIEIRVNPSLIRDNEILKMCGDPMKLNELLRQHGEELIIPSFEKTLRSMLINAQNQSV